MIRKKILRTSSVIAIAGTLSFAPTAVLAQAAPAEDAERGDVGPEASVPADTGEIIVTAQRREERLVDVPITVTTLSGETLATANVQELSDLSVVTPALRFDSQNAFFQPSIRGIGTGVTTAGGGANVGIYVDGFYSPNPLAADFELLNIESIQVLKGPQGTLFGRNTTGGAILLETAEPRVEPGAAFELSYGRFNEIRAQGYVTYGLSYNVAIDVEGLYRKGDGWRTNVLNGNRNQDDFRNGTVRTGLKINFSDSISLLLRYTHSEIDDPTSQLTNSNVDPTIDLTTGRPFGIQTRTVPGTFTTDPDEFAADRPTFFRSNSDIIQGTINIDLGVANLTSYTQYRDEKSDQSLNLDQTALTIFQLGLPVTNETFSQEFLLSSKPGLRLQWTAGLFYLDNTDTFITLIDNNAATRGRIRLAGSSAPIKSYAAFLDATYEVIPQLFITAGARYAHDTVEDAFFNLPFTNGQRQFVPDLKSDKLTPRFVVRYKPTEESSVYASYAKGYKAGILDVGGSTGNPVKPEEIDAFEIGFKYGRPGLNFASAAYYYDYKDLQVSIFRNATAQIVNAAESRIYGVEGQLRYDLTDRFNFSLGGAYTNAQYEQFGFVSENGAIVGAPIYASCPATNPPPGTCTGGQIFFVNTNMILTDVPIQRAPKFTGNVTARYESDLAGGELVLSGNLYYTSKFFFSPSGTQFPQEGYEVLALRAEWTDPSDTYFIALFGDNVTDSRYRTQVQYNNFGIGATYSQPATYGIEFGARF